MITKVCPMSPLIIPCVSECTISGTLINTYYTRYQELHFDFVKSVTSILASLKLPSVISITTHFR